MGNKKKAYLFLCIFLEILEYFPLSATVHVESLTHLLTVIVIDSLDRVVEVTVILVTSTSIRSAFNCLFISSISSL